MPTAFNLTRPQSEKFKSDIDVNKFCWISIMEPTIKKSEPSKHITNPILDKCDNLKLMFWDVEVVVKHPVFDPELGKFCEVECHPPTEKDAKDIVDFIIKNQNKHVITNCAMGKSRSGAISYFCHKILNYEWDEPSRRRAMPNMYLFDMMVTYYSTYQDTERYEIATPFIQ